MQRAIDMKKIYRIHRSRAELCIFGDKTSVPSPKTAGSAFLRLSERNPSLTPEQQLSHFSVDIIVKLIILGRKGPGNPPLANPASFFRGLRRQAPFFNKC